MAAGTSHDLGVADVPIVQQLHDIVDVGVEVDGGRERAGPLGEAVSDGAKTA
jgi:hypothetical protein